MSSNNCVYNNELKSSDDLISILNLDQTQLNDKKIFKYKKHQKE